MGMFLLLTLFVAASMAALPQIPGTTGYYSTCTRRVPDPHFPLSLPRVEERYRCWRWYDSSRLQAYRRRIERERALAEAQAIFQEQCGGDVKWSCRAKRCQNSKSFTFTKCCENVERDCDEEAE